MGIGKKGSYSEEIFNEVSDNLKALERLFPSVVKDGQVDFEALKEELGQFEEVGPEKYGLTWSGKQNAKKIAQEDIMGKTLKFVEEDSKNPETTENLYIEGDNLEVLKLLRQNYYGAIKMIYIDPPYNTGNDFVYNDKFDIDKEESDLKEGDISELGERYTINSKSTNRYHANWLNMMYPRLKLAKDLLNMEGVIFISIDDAEVANLKTICDEIFGEVNFVGCAGRITKKSNNKGDFWAPNFDYVLTYVKDRNFAESFFGGVNYNAYNLEEVEGPKRGEKYQLVRLYMSSLENRNPEQRFWIECPDGSKIIPPGTTLPPERPNLGDGIWRWTRKKYEEEKHKIVIKQVKSSNLIDQNGNKAKWNVFTKTYLSDVIENSTAKPNNFIEGYINQMGSHEINSLNIPFDYSKPTALIKYLIDISKTDKNSIILDFFSGSSTSAHAVMQANADNGGNRKYIMVQIPEETSTKTEAYKNGYKNICEIGKERIRRAGEKIKEENKDKEGIENLDIGFKVFKVGDTNIRWNHESDNLKTLAKEVITSTQNEQTAFDFIAATTNQVSLDEVVSPKDRLDFMPGFKDIDVVYEILLRQRDIPLSSKVELLKEIGERTYLFADSYLVCLEENITSELIEKLAELNPLPIKFVLRDSAFGDDIELKDETSRRLEILIEKNIGENKKTYTVEYI